MTHVQDGEQQRSSLNLVFNSRLLPRRRRKVHHKVKTGCKACKHRRQKVSQLTCITIKLTSTKCDEKVPICTGCSRYSTECIYPTKDHTTPQQVAHSSGMSMLNMQVFSPPTKGHSASPLTDLDFGQLELLHQFLTSTCIAPDQQPEMTLHIQRTIFPLAQTYPFVMRGILAMAAMHLSWLRPSRQAYYATLASRNHDDALPEFQSALQNINQENCHAVISYAKSLLWCSMAGHGNTNSAMKIGNNWLPQWFWLLRGSCQVVEFSRSWITEGPHAQYEPAIIIDYSKSPDDHRISELVSQLSLLTGSSLCQNVLSRLREAFARASIHHHSTPVRNAMNFWVGSLSDDFIQLLQEKEPWTLVALAHFCILVQRFETLWFMKGHATSLLLAIAESLDEKWRCYIQWPCEELEIQPFG